MCIYKEHYEQILSVFPAVVESAAQDCITIPTSPMTGIIRVKQRGQSVMRLEIGFHYRHGEELLPDHKMTVKLDLHERKAIPESIWFKCRGTTHTREPKKGVNEQILNVMNNRLTNWLGILAGNDNATIH